MQQTTFRMRSGFIQKENTLKLQLSSGELFFMILTATGLHISDITNHFAIKD